MNTRRVRTIWALAAVMVLLLARGGAQAQPREESANKLLVQQFTEACNTKKFARLGDFVNKGFKRHCQATPTVTVRSLDEFIEFLSADGATFPDAIVSMNQLIEEGDRVAFWGTFNGTQRAPMGPIPASMKKVVLDVSGVFRIESGKIAELWITWDNMAVFTQLELAPAREEPAEKPRDE